MHNFQATSHFPDKKQKNHLTVALGNDYRPYAKFYIGSGIALHNQWIPGFCPKSKLSHSSFVRSCCSTSCSRSMKYRVSGKRQKKTDRANPHNLSVQGAVPASFFDLTLLKNLQIDKPLLKNILCHIWMEEKIPASEFHLFS